MTIELSVAPDVFARLRETPWDAKALGRRTLDITDIALATENGGRAADDAALFGELERFVTDKAVGLVTLRIHADRRAAVGRLQQAGFRYVETVYRLSYRNLARFEPPPRAARPMVLRDAVTADRDALLAQAADSFPYGRFAEDPAIPAAINRRRQIDWMEGLLAGRARVLVADAGAGPGAFMALTVENGAADLILAGTQPEMAVLAYPLWVAVMMRLKAEGVTRVDTTVSAANIGVVNLYGTLGFRFEQALVGLHLHRA